MSMTTGKGSKFQVQGPNLQETGVFPSVIV